MAAELVVAPEAEQDITDAYAWYEERRPGLGEEFLSCVGNGVSVFLDLFLIGKVPEYRIF
ncbi:MAG: hypothetical protein AB1374_12100 [Bacillota bacterium]